MAPNEKQLIIDQYIQAELVGIKVKSFCEAFGLSERTLYYWKKDVNPDGRILLKDRKKLNRQPIN